MTRTTNARIVGLTYLLYIAASLPAMILFDRAASGSEPAARLDGIAAHAADVRLVVLLSVVSCFAALVLAVTLYALTRDEDRDLAMLGLTCRVGEGVLGAIGIPATLGLLWLGTEVRTAQLALDAPHALGAFLFSAQDWITIVSATFFAVGSTLFSWLLLRGRLVPAPLAWLGVLASLLLVAALPLQLIGFLRGALFGVVWLPMLVFEVVLALWLIIRGVNQPRSVAS